MQEQEQDSQEKEKSEKKEQSQGAASARDGKPTTETFRSVTEILNLVPRDPDITSKMASFLLESFRFHRAEEDDGDSELSTITLPRGIPFNLVSIREVMTELQAALFRSAFGENKELEKIGVDISKQSPQILCKFPCVLSDGFTLPLAGTVSLSPSANCVPLCVP